MLLYILVATLFGSILSLFGGVLLLLRKEFAKKLSLTLVSFAAGSLIGAAFFELVPEALQMVAYERAAWALVFGIIIFFLFERFLKWYHCHDQETCDYHTFSSTVLFGDALHNFVDGVAIALSFSVGVAPGIATAVAVFLHEIPQEMGDFGVLLHAGWEKRKVFIYNSLTAFAAVAGALFGYVLLPLIQPFLGSFLAFVAGTFVYISVSDLLPELRHRANGVEVGHFASLIFGILLVFWLGIILPE